MCFHNLEISQIVVDGRLGFGQSFHGCYRHLLFTGATLSFTSAEMKGVEDITIVMEHHMYCGIIAIQANIDGYYQSLSVLPSSCCVQSRKSKFQHSNKFNLGFFSYSVETDGPRLDTRWRRGSRSPSPRLMVKFITVPRMCRMQPVWIAYACLPRLTSSSVSIRNYSAPCRTGSIPVSFIHAVLFVSRDGYCCFLSYHISDVRPTTPTQRLWRMVILFLICYLN